jgi:hypothetical protein
MTRDTAEFLLGLIDQVTLSAGSDDFAAVAQRIVNAKTELAAIAAGAEDAAPVRAVRE